MPQKRKTGPKHAGPRNLNSGRAPRAQSSFATPRKRERNMFSSQNTPKARRAGRFSTSPVDGASSFFSPTDGDAMESTPEVVLTRRNLLIGAAGVGGIAAVGIGGSYALDAFGGQNSNVEHISVAEGDVVTLDDYEEVEPDEFVSKVNEISLPYGTLVWADNDTYAAVLEPTEGADPLNTVKLLNLKSGNTVTMLKGAQGAKDGFQIFDVRASEEGMVWTEVDVFTSTWRVYIGTIAGGELSNILQVDEADSAWVTPSIAAVGNKAFWQVVPHAGGAAADADSVLKVAAFGSDAVEVAWSVRRPFATPVTPATDGVIITPRSTESSSYFQLVKISATDATTVDSMTLPSSMTPSFTGYGNSGFAFAFDSIYNYGDGISNLGTYTPTGNSKNYLESQQWFRFPRTPTAGPSWCGNWFMVKSNRAICGVDFEGKRYFLINVVSGVDTYGEYLASTGTGKYVVGLSQVKKSGGTTGNALVRVFEIK